MEPRSLGESLRHLFTRVLFAGEPDRDTRIRRVPFLVVLLLPAAILYPTLGFHLLEPDEGRYAQIPKEMLVNNSWVVPTLQGEPYLDKPPLLYWLVALSYRAFGVSPAAARLVPAVCVHLTILAVYLIGRRSIGQRAAFWAALLLSVAPGFVSVARLLLLDGLLTLCVTLSVLCGFEAVRTGRFQPGWWLAAALASGLGFLTKGPISEVLLFVPLWVYAYLAGRTPLPLPPPPGGEGDQGPSPPGGGVGVGSARVRWYWYGIFIAIVVAVNVPWYVAMYREQPQFLGYFFWQHNVMRFLQPFDHLQPIWYYVPILVAGLLPGTVLLGGVLVAAGQSRRRRTECVPAIIGRWILAARRRVVRLLLQLFRQQAADVHSPRVPVPVPGDRGVRGPLTVESRGLDARPDRQRPRRSSSSRITTRCRGTPRSDRPSAGRNSSSGMWTTRRRRWCASRGTAIRWRSTPTARTCATSARRT